MAFLNVWAAIFAQVSGSKPMVYSGGGESVDQISRKAEAAGGKGHDLFDVFRRRFKR
jgi:hypothetical protein